MINYLKNLYADWLLIRGINKKLKQLQKIYAGRFPKKSHTYEGVDNQIIQVIEFTDGSGEWIIWLSNKVISHLYISRERNTNIPSLEV